MRLTLFILCATTLALCGIGCKSQTTSSSPKTEVGGTKAASASGARANALSPLDPCPERLHDLAGAMLDFIRQYDQLPPALEDLKPMPGTTLVTACPATNQKYIYNPGGIKIPPNRWAVVYDAAPSHSGMRWAIVFSDPQPGKLPVPTVMAIAEQDFKAVSEVPGTR